MRTFNTSRCAVYTLLVCAALTAVSAEAAAQYGSGPAPLANANWRTVPGRAFYEKFDVTSAGLDLNDPVMVPIRNARVEVIDPSSGNLLSVSATDNFGGFEIVAPAQTKCTVRVLSRLRASNVLVLDNTNGNSLYFSSSDLNPQDTHVLITALDSNRISGAFNILEMLQRGSETVGLADSSLTPLEVTVYWSPKNSPAAGAAKETIGSTYFDAKARTITLVGDRSVDSDEFDDAVILHEYGHLVAAAFSQDSSPGGVHILGDALDPRLAWSEGWANFFSSAARDDPYYRDSYGPSGSRVLQYDLQVAVPPGDGPGYWSEFSVHSILWSLFEGNFDGTGASQPSITNVWPAFTDLKQNYFVYLPYFLEHTVARNPQLTGNVIALAQSHFINFQPNVQPSVPNPFPTPINVGQPVTGTVDSLTTQRIDLLHSSDFLTFTSTGGRTSIRLDVTGLGTGNDPNSNNLDLFLYGLDGHLIAFADRGLNGQSQLIPVVLDPAGYVIEVRTYYIDGDTNKTVFNSGTYQLTVLTP